MFDAADLVTLPVPATESSRKASIAQGKYGGARRDPAPNGGTLAEAERTRGLVSEAEAVSPYDVKRKACYVVEACAMGGDSIAVAMSDGRLCHAELSDKADLGPQEEQRPAWSSWRSKHGSVLSLKFSQAHDALVTLEHAATAAGDQVFLSRYHRPVVAGRQQQAQPSTGGNDWVNCSIPLATSHACMAVCPCRGWVAVCTGSVVNLWAVAHPGWEAPNGTTRAAESRQTLGGFEHALAVDLAELVGSDGMVDQEGGVKQVALYGNILAVATDHAVFLVALNFQVKGSAPPRPYNGTTNTGDAASTASTSLHDSHSPSAHAVQRYAAGLDSKKTTKAGLGVASSANTDSKSHSQVPPKAASRSSQSRKGKDDQVDGKAVPVAARKEAGKAKWGGGWREGFVEGTVLEADDMVVCVLHPEGNDQGQEANGPVQPPPVLRAFDDDWEAFRTRNEQSRDPWELENTPLAKDSPPLSLPVTANPAVLDHADRCDVVLARRVGAGEVVREVHLLPVAPREDLRPLDVDSHRVADLKSPPGNDGCIALHACRFMLLTNKSATVCVISTTCATSKTSTFPSALSDSPSSLVSSPSSPTSTSSRRDGVNMRESGVGGGVGLLGRLDPPESTSQSAPLRGGEVSAASVDTAAADTQHVVHLWCNCRFNNELVRASISRSLLFALTLEGVEVWTLPSTNHLVDHERNGNWWEYCGSPRMGMSSRASPARPCLMHIQELEIGGMLPRLPPRCIVSLGGARPGLILVPCHPEDRSLEGVSLTFLARQCRRQRLRSPAAADEAFAAEVLALSEPPREEVLGEQAKQDSWQLKCTAWRRGFCGLGGWGTGGGTEGASTHSASLSLALFLRLRSSTETFCLLTAAEGRARRPMSPGTSAIFVSAAEGLYGALIAESDASWRAARSAARATDERGLPGKTVTATPSAKGGSPPSFAGIETILPGLANCWRLQRLAKRCASLISRLLLEEATRAAPTEGKSAADRNAPAKLAYARACAWLLASAESVVESFSRLHEAAERVVEAGACSEPRSPCDVEGIERQKEQMSSILAMDEDADDFPSDASTSESSCKSPHSSPSKAMYELYLLPALGMRDAEFCPPQVSSPLVLGELTSFDDTLSGLVAYLHGQDTQWLSQSPRLPNSDGIARRSPSLSTAVVCAGRVPWADCPVALSHALIALDEQEAAWKQSPSSAKSCKSSSSGSSGTLFSGLTDSPRSANSPAPASKTRDTRLSGGAARRRRRQESGRVDEIARPGNSNPAANRRSLPTTHEWVVVARAILASYAEGVNDSSAELASTRESLNSSMEVTATAAAAVVDQHILQLACENHPTLVAPARIGAGPLARGLLAGGRSRPLVAALVSLTSSCEYGTTGDRRSSYGPHRVQELLGITEKFFSPRIDPLLALRVFGIPGRQIAARLDSLRRASLDTTEVDRSPRHVDSDLSDFVDKDTSQQITDGVEVRLGKREEKILASAAREFLSRRCALSLATVDRSAREDERLSEALGAPPAWQASLARSRALDRAILRYLIGAHLDDLRALETSTAQKSNASSAVPSSSRPWGSGLSGITSGARFENTSNGEKHSWADTMVPLLTSQVSTGGGSAAEGHVGAIMALVRDVTWRGGDQRVVRGGGGRGMSPEEASEVVKEAKRRLPVDSSVSASPNDMDDDITDDATPWGSMSAGMEMGRVPWPWGPRAVPPSAVGAMVALAAALPPAGKLLAGIDLVLQVAGEVVAAAKAEAAVAAGKAAAASGSGGKRIGRWSHESFGTTKTAGSSDAAVAEACVASVEEISRAAERAVLLYANEYCGKDPDSWASVTDHVRNVSGGPTNEFMTFGRSEEDARQKLVGSLLRKCGDELGGRAMVRALPEGLDLMECLDEVERSFLKN